MCEHGTTEIYLYKSCGASGPGLQTSRGLHPTPPRALPTELGARRPRQRARSRKNNWWDADSGPGAVTSSWERAKTWGENRAWLHRARAARNQAGGTLCSQAVRRERKDLADISCSCPQPRFLQHSLARPQPSLKHSGPARGTRPGQQQHGAAVECWLCLSSDRAVRLCSCWMCPAPAPGSLTQQSPASQGACRWQGFPGHRQGLAVRFLQQTISVHWGSQENRKERL